MNFVRKCLNRRANNLGVIIAIYCSIPSLFLSNSNAKSGQPLTLGAVVALCLVLGVGLAAFFICRKRQAE